MYGCETPPNSVVIVIGNMLIFTLMTYLLYTRAALVMKGFEQACTLKNNSKTSNKWYNPTTHIGANIAKFQVPDTGKMFWPMPGHNYIRGAIKVVEATLAESDRQQCNNTNLAVQTCYRPELDTSPVLEDDDNKYYQVIVDQPMWALELGNIDI